jgi:hypothetical protein
MASLKSTAQSLQKTTGPATVVYSLKGIYTTSSAANIGDRTSGEQTLTGTTGYYGYDRIADSTDEYEQINPFAVEDGHAPDPANFPPSPISYSLAAWDQYEFNHYNASRAKSTNFDLTSIGYTTANFSWTLPSGYSRNTGELQQYLYIDNCGVDCEASGSDCCGANVNDVSSFNKTGLSNGQNYSATLKTDWDSKGTGFNRFESDKASLKGTLTNGTPNTFGGIGFTTDTCPPNCVLLGTNHVLTNTAPGGSCLGAGGSQNVYSDDVGSGPLSNTSNGDCLHTTQGALCDGSNYLCGSTVGTQYVHDGTYWVEVNASGCIIDGPTACL